MYSASISRSSSIPRPRPCNYVTITAEDAGDTEAVAAISNGHIVVVSLIYSNKGDGETTASLKWGSGSTFMTVDLLHGSITIHNFIGCEIQGETNTALNVNLSDAGTVHVTIGYLIVAGPGAS